MPDDIEYEGQFGPCHISWAQDNYTERVVDLDHVDRGQIHDQHTKRERGRYYFTASLNEGTCHVEQQDRRLLLLTSKE
jgi:hypothetical protein